MSKYNLENSLIYNNGPGYTLVKEQLCDEQGNT